MIINNIVMLLKEILHILKRIFSFYRTDRININDDIYILGNGPSLNKLNFNKTKGEYCCVNYFPIKSKKFDIIKPRYLCLADPEFINNKLNKSENIKLINKLEKVNWEMFVICPINFKKKIILNNKNICFIYVDEYRVENFGRRIRYILYDNNFGCVGAQNVVCLALYYFIFVKCKNIYLCGVDMSEFKDIFVDNKCNIYMKTNHFYKKDSFERIEYINKGEFYIFLEMYCKMFKEFNELSKYAKYKNVNVYNTSIDSYIDVFEKINSYNEE